MYSFYFPWRIKGRINKITFIFCTQVTSMNESALTEWHGMILLLVSKEVVTRSSIRTFSLIVNCRPKNAGSDYFLLCKRDCWAQECKFKYGKSLYPSFVSLYVIYFRFSSWQSRKSLLSINSNVLCYAVVQCIHQKTNNRAWRFWSIMCCKQLLHFPDYLFTYI